MRNRHLDTYKGVAAVGIILIHTVFFSGEAYVPETVRTLALLLDVPFFFFLSGWGSAYSEDKGLLRTLESLLRIFGKYLLFTTAFFAGWLLLTRGKMGGFENLRSFLSVYAHNALILGEPLYGFAVVLQSLWFLPVYFTVVLLAKTLLTAVKSGGNGYKAVWLLLAAAFCGLCYSWCGGNFFYIGAPVLFHLCFFLLGYRCRDVVLRPLQFIALTALGVAALLGYAWASGTPVSPMQAAKFPPAPSYFIYSCLVLPLALVLRRAALRRNPFEWVGKNALSYFFCQGVASQALYLVESRIPFMWYLKLPVCFALNLALTTLLVLGMTLAYRVANAVWRRVKPHIAAFFSGERRLGE